ncbi:MAG: choice-of-anchor B family protein [Gemmatimonadales bacterium]
MFGAGLAGAGDLAVVGGPMAEFFEGLGWVYGREGGEWKEQGTVADRPASMTAITGGERKCQPGGGDIEGFSCKEVDLAAFIPTAALGAKRGIMINDLWGWTDPETNREYALVGKMDGTVFVDVTDPTNPRVLGELPLHQGAQVNLWRDIKTYQNHAFIVSDGAGPHGMQIFDLTQLRNVANPPVTFKETAHYDKMASAHNIVIDEASGFAYTVGNSAGGETCGGALHIIDIRDPKNPVFAGCHADPATGNARTGYTHDAQCVVYHGPDQRYAGKEVCFNASETAVGIADVTDKKAPKPIAVAAYPNTSYAHQGWLTDDHKYFFLDDEGDEIAGTAAKTRTMIWDVTKLDEPVLVKEFLGTTAASDHNLYIKGNYVFQSNYVAGLRILDISDPTNPRETGYFDTVPFGENVPGFAGSWSNSPYFKSGTILVTSMREGLFILKHRPERPVP